MSHAYLTPDLVITTYRGSPVSFVMVPTQGGAAITDLDEYPQIDFSLWTGTRESPGTKVLTVKYAGDAPNYITVEEVDHADVPAGAMGIRVALPAAVSLALAAGSYFAELFITPPGGEATFTNWATWNHEPTTAS